ncbi:MAG: hypothetical protein QNL89_02490 [Flavobacteriaceae bacterium]|jgi:hypothetical protein|tara:strand:+ start:7407 stop:7712 length:306 start_codon:yes stop_codon:yes gene_type:complete
MNQLLLEEYLYFNVIASTVVVGIGYLLSKNVKTKDYVGFLYLFGIPLKGVFFYKSFPFLFLDGLSLSLQEKGNILMPILFFLAVEVLFLLKFLKQTPSSQI